MNHQLEKTIVTLFLLVFIVFGFFRGGAFKSVDDLAKAAIAEIAPASEEKKAEDTVTFAAASAALNKSLSFNRPMIDLNGSLAKALNMRELYRTNGGVVLSNGYVAGIYNRTSTDYEYEQLLDLKSFLDERDIQLLYVNEPTKYNDDTVIQDELALTSYVNDNADRLLERLRAAGINCMDLRETLAGESSFQWFYRTDHHWTVPAAKAAARAIAETLNRDYGYHIDLSLYDDDNFEYTEYKNAWLGEQGKKIGASFVGLDDYTLITPKYDTELTLKNGKKEKTGSFEDVLVKSSVLSPKKNKDIYTASSWHYTYQGNSGLIKNALNTEGKKVLVLGDSYDAVTNAFLALGISEVRGLIMRNYKEDLRAYIDRKQFDTVIIAYAEFMIGAHDKPESANYKMFDFGKTEP